VNKRRTLTIFVMRRAPKNQKLATPIGVQSRRRFTTRIIDLALTRTTSPPFWNRVL
jgi:hypothetical protein